MIKKNVIPYEWFVDPVTKEPLRIASGTAQGTSGTYHCSPEHKVWSFIPQNLPDLNTALWETWKTLQDNGMVAYTQDPEHNLGVGDRPEFRAFADFCQMTGRVLDIGCGPQAEPTHLHYATNSSLTYIGIDPLLGTQPRTFPFIQGLGEYLPFAPRLFDQILFVTSLDHFIHPVAALKEASRTLTKSGTICIWHQVKSPNAPKPKMSHDWYDSLAVPNGAEDRFHMKHFCSNELRNYLEKADLLIADSIVTEINEFQTRYFYRVTLK